MKNLKKQITRITAFAVTALFMNFTVMAQDWGSQDTTSQETSKDTSKVETQAEPQEQNQRMNESMSSGSMSSDQNTNTKEDDKGVSYNEEIQKDELPQEVNSSLQELYPAHEVSKVYRGDDDSFKVKVKNQDDEAVVYYGSEGEFKRAQNLSGLQQEGAFPQEQGQRTREDINQDNTQGTWGTDARETREDIEGTIDEGQQEIEGAIDEGQQEIEGTIDEGRQEIEETEREWGTEGNQDNEGSAYPQEQNQRSDDEFKSQGERDLNDDWGTGTGVQGTDPDTQNDAGTIDHNTEEAEDQWGTQDNSSDPQEQNQMGTQPGTGSDTGTQTETGTQGQFGNESESDTTNVGTGTDMR